MAKSRERLLARGMRKNGESIREIAKKLGISKSSVSLWCRDVILSEKQVRDLLNRDIIGGIKGRLKAWEWHRAEKRNRLKHFHQIGYQQVEIINNKELFFVGISAVLV